MGILKASSPQAGIFQEGSAHCYYLEYQLDFSQLAQIRLALSQSLRPYQDEAISHRKAGHLSPVNCVVSFGKKAWKALATEDKMPESLTDFVTIEGKQGFRAPSTQSDVFFWLHGGNIADVFDQARWIHSQMKTCATLSLEQAGFDYHHSLDLIGFEDSTANPKTDELKRAAALIPDGNPGAGGSLVFCQKWVHDMDKWNQVPMHCQEAIVGRTKIENEELEGDAMPSDSHVSRTDLKVDGVAMKIYRRSSPFGTVMENGLMFLAFACETIRISSQLESMYGLSADGQIDQLLHYSEAVTGGYWFAPSQQDLASVLVDKS